MKKYKIATLLFVCIILCSCGEKQNNATSSNKETPTNSTTSTTSVVATITNSQPEDDPENIISEPTTEFHEESYYDNLTYDNDETIEYKEVYNNKDISINTINYLHDDNNCYVEFRIDNNSDRDIVVEELTYSLNYRTYDIDSNSDSLPKIIIKSKKSNTVKYDMGYVNDFLVYKDITDMMFLVSISDKETENIIDKPFIVIQTSKHDGYARYKEYPPIKSTDNFDYKFTTDTVDLNNGDYYIRIFNKTGNIYRVNISDVYINDYSAQEDSDAFYSSGRLIALEDGDYCMLNKNNYILPYCFSDIAIGLHNKDFVKKTNSDTVNSIDAMVEYYSIDNDSEPQIKENMTITIK